MKFVLMLIAAACAGALTVVAVPTAFVTDVSAGVRHARLADFNPFQGIFDSEQRTVLTGTSPEQLGLHSSAVTLTPMPLAPPPSLKLDLGRAYEAQAQSQIDQGIRRSQDMQAYTNNPSAWSGPPPN